MLKIALHKRRSYIISILLKISKKKKIKKKNKIKLQSLIINHNIFINVVVIIRGILEEYNKFYLARKVE